MIRWTEFEDLRGDDETTYHYALGVDEELHQFYSLDLSCFSYSNPYCCYANAYEYRHGNMVHRAMLSVEQVSEESDLDFWERLKVELADFRDNTHAYMVEAVL